MKKGNNKGFAITTVIYGLSIMGIMIVAILMATMSSNRSHTSELSKSIEDELNRVGNTETYFSFKINNDSANVPLAQQYIVPEGQSGFYRIELWGAQGGGTDGGKGAYTSGIIYLKEGQILYFYVGRHQATGGGRETDVRIVSGGYNEKDSFSRRIMVAAGGGAASTAAGGTLYTYNDKMTALGGAINVAGTTPNYKLNSGTLIGLPSTYTLTGSKSAKDATGTSISSTNNGGDGYMPSNDGAYGGTSYISGYGGGYTLYQFANGVDTMKKTRSTFTLQTKKYNETTGEETIATVDNQKYYFIDGRMYAGVNTGDGKAKIERITTSSDRTELVRNNKFKNVKSITDCITVGSTGINKVAISVMSAGVDLGNDSITMSGGCATITFTQPIELIDEIDVWHYKGNTLVSGVDLVKHQISVKDNSSTVKYLKNASEISETETVVGTRISAYQPDAGDKTVPLPSGDYYIMPVTAEGKVVSAYEKAADDSNPLKIEPINGYKRQRWSIELITDKSVSKNYQASNINTYEYKIIEQTRYKAMAIYEDENIEKNQIKANQNFNNYNRDEPQIWKVYNNADGTYIIETAVPTHSSSRQTGYLYAQTNPSETNFHDMLLIGLKEKTTLRFKLIAIDYRK